MLNRFTADYLETLGNADFVAAPKVSGRLASFDGLLMEAVGLTLPVGTVCTVGEGSASVEAEVIGFRNGRTLLMNLGGPAALLPRAPVKPIGLYDTAEDAKFWQGVRANPKRSTAEVRSQFRDIDRRLADIELHYTSRNSQLANEIESLR